MAEPELRERARRRTRARGRFVHHHPGRPGRRHRARPCRGRRGAHGHRRLSLVHRLGPRHDDLARRADARHRPGRGSQVDPAHLRRLRRGRADPEHVPGGRHRRALPHRRRDAVVLSRGRALPRPLPGRGDAGAAAADPAQDRAPPHRGLQIRHPGRSAGRAADAGRRGLSADLDGRQGRRLGGDPAARQGGRDQRAVVQRAVPAARTGCAPAATPMPTTSPRGPSRRGARSTAASGTTRAASCTTSSTARTATTRHSARTRSSRSRSTIRCSTRSAGARWSTRCARGS